MRPISAARLSSAKSQRFRTQTKLQGAALQAYRTHQASSIKLPFLAIASATLILALAIAFYKFPRLEVTQDFRPAGLDVEKDSIWNHRHLWLGAIAIFIYVGAEVSIGSFLVKYFADPNILGISLENGAKLVTLYWAGMMVGRFIGSAAMRRIAANKILMWAGFGAAILVGGSLLGHGHFAASPSSRSDSSTPSCSPQSLRWRSQNWARSPGVAQVCWCRPSLAEQYFPC